MTIEEFIEARIAEREAAADCATANWQADFVDGVDIEGTLGGAVYDYVRDQDPARVLGQCAALRSVLEFGATLVSASQQIEFEDTVLLHVAAIWSTHHDYRPEWAVDGGGSKP